MNRPVFLSFTLLSLYFLLSSCTSALHDGSARKIQGWPKLEAKTVQNICVQSADIHKVCRDEKDLSCKSFTIDPTEFQRDFRQLIEISGFTVVESGGQNCDVTLAVDLEAVPNKKKYTFRSYRYHKGDKVPIPLPGSGYTRECYGGAGAKGELLVSGHDIESFNVSIGGKYEAGAVSERECGPIMSRFQNAWRSAVLKGFVSLWGPRVLIAWVANEEYEIGDIAVESYIPGNYPGGGPFDGYTLTVEDVRKLTHVLDTGKNLRVNNAFLLLEFIGPPAIDMVPVILRYMQTHSSFDFIDRKLPEKTLRSISGMNFKTLDEWALWWSKRNTFRSGS